MRRIAAVLIVGLLLGRSSGAAPPRNPDVAAARALFEKNLEAIRKRDKAAYLSCYLDSPKLAKTGADGITLGYPWRTARTSEPAARAWWRRDRCSRRWTTG